jgi:hypothetical protein
MALQLESQACSARDSAPVPSSFHYRKASKESTADVHQSGNYLALIGLTDMCGGLWLVGRLQNDGSGSDRSRFF